MCGDSSCGQCGPAHIKQGCCHDFIDMGPEVSWHGLNRPTATQIAAAGGNLVDALPKVRHHAIEQDQVHRAGSRQSWHSADAFVSEACPSYEWRRHGVL